MAITEKLQAARMFLCAAHPYISGLIWTLRPVEKPGIKTMGVDHHWRLYYDPEIDTLWSPEEVTGVLFHEINHILRDHVANGRGGNYKENKELFNIAADLEINPGITDLGFQLPAGGVFPDKMGYPKGLLAEEYFDLLSKDPRTQKMMMPGKPDKDKEGKQPGHGQCGSCAGNSNEFEDGEPNETDKIGQTEKELIRRDVAKQIQQHIKNAGTVPAGLELWADQLLNPKVPWQKELRTSSCRMINEVAGKREYSFRRPSRRQSSKEVLFPTLKDFRPNIGIIRDTSGSMGSSDHARTLAETKGILDALGVAVIDIEVDCEVHAVKKIKSVRDVKLQGGGGTDMGIGITHAEGLRPKLDMVVVLTDGYTPWPAQAPSFKTIVVLTQASCKEQVPHWAKCIVIND